eukprot:11735973-Heterocapsa_arctica.AAC.1
MMDEDPSMLDIAKFLGSARASDETSSESQWLDAKLTKVRARLFKTLEHRDVGKKAAEHTIWNAELAEAYSNMAQDPDKEFIRW